MTEGNGENIRSVLVVEDDPEINRLIGAYVEHAGFRYIAALNGAQAISQIHAHPPCVVILDLMLPDVSGWEICRRLKSDPETSDIPIIILTALDTEESRQEGVRSGAAEYRTKPFDPDELLEVLVKYAGTAEAKVAK